MVSPVTSAFDGTAPFECGAYSFYRTVVPNPNYYLPQTLEQLEADLRAVIQPSTSPSQNSNSRITTLQSLWNKLGIRSAADALAFLSLVEAEHPSLGQALFRAAWVLAGTADPNEVYALLRPLVFYRPENASEYYTLNEGELLKDGSRDLGSLRLDAEDKGNDRYTYLRAALIQAVEQKSSNCSAGGFTLHAPSRTPSVTTPANAPGNPQPAPSAPASPEQASAASSASRFSIVTHPVQIVCPGPSDLRNAILTTDLSNIARELSNGPVIAPVYVYAKNGALHRLYLDQWLRTPEDLAQFKLALGQAVTTYCPDSDSEIPPLVTESNPPSPSADKSLGSFEPSTIEAGNDACEIRDRVIPGGRSSALTLRSLEEELSRNWSSILDDQKTVNRSHPQWEVVRCGRLQVNLDQMMTGKEVILRHRDTKEMILIGRDGNRFSITHTNGCASQLAVSNSLEALERVAYEVLLSKPYIDSPKFRSTPHLDE